jgi:hypothetical protein
VKRTAVLTDDKFGIGLALPPGAIRIPAASFEDVRIDPPQVRLMSEENFTMSSDQARQRAEKSFRQEERAREAKKAMAEYEAQAIAVRKKTAHLKALRLAKEAQGSVSESVAKLRSLNRSVGTPPRR